MRTLKSLLKDSGCPYGLADAKAIIVSTFRGFTVLSADTLACRPSFARVFVRQACERLGIQAGEVGDDVCEPILKALLQQRKRGKDGKPKAAGQPQATP